MHSHKAKNTLKIYNLIKVLLVYLLASFFYYISSLCRILIQPYNREFYMILTFTGFLNQHFKFCFGIGFKSNRHKV